MKKDFLKMASLFAVISFVALLVGCGGGGGGGGAAGPLPETPQVPSDRQFEVPTGFSSQAFPKQGPAVSLMLNNFAPTSEAYLYLMNYSAQAQTVSYNVSGEAFAASARFSRADKGGSGSPITPEQLFHLRLRQAARQTPISPKTADAPAASLRAAITVGTEDTFNVYTTGTTVTAISAVCKKVEGISGEIKKLYFFVDKADENMANLNTLLDNLASNWAAIYVKNREIFGEEPTGDLGNGVNTTDFYILLSRRVFTAGYFYTGDLSPVGSVADSNQKKMFNLQLPPGINTAAGVNNIDVVTRDLSATMAHEFQHMIHYHVRGSVSEVWLEEAMSGYAEFINGYKIENGQNQSKALQSNKYFEQIDSISFNKWHETTDSGDVVNAYYGKVYLFGVWLAQNYGSNGSVRTLLAQKVKDGAAIEAFTGQTLEEVYAKFAMALSVNDYENGGVYGIKNLNITGTYAFGDGLDSVTLKGPLTDAVSAVDGGNNTFTMPPYTARYVKITGGDGKGVTISATLPDATAVYQLNK